jgi:hypothetical protein
MAKPIPVRDLQAIFMPRGRRVFLIPANDTKAPADVQHVGGWRALLLMLAVAAAIGWFIGTGGAL